MPISWEDFEESFPQTAWLRHYNVPGWGRNPFQQWLAGRAAPAYGGWLGRQSLPGATPAEFEPSAGLSSGAAGLGALRGAKGLGSEAQEQWFTDIGGSEGLAMLLENAYGRGGLGFAAPVANIIGGRARGMRQGWEAAMGGGANVTENFIPWLMYRLGIS